MTHPDNLSTIDTVLVANRGEIAVRVIRSARAHGYRTVAVYSDADAGAPHVALADDAVRLGPAPAADSYLDIDAVIAAARISGAQAIHPGYGFLAENAGFARAVADAGLVFIGPTPDAIDLMGDKAAAKRRMADAGVPLLPGYQGTDQSDETLLAEADRIGLPLMVKAAAGGGGKGMRLVTDATDLPDALAAARREATSAFGDDTLILERALLHPRHVEIQVLADTHGNVVALGERDCSVQRRHQKVVEEAPSPAIDAVTRAAMQQAAVTAAADIGYVGAGTVEFLLDVERRDGHHQAFAFLEMNTRLQVEHPVTELVTGIDLVEWQLRVARGESLAFGQDDIILDGHAIEVRLYAEDPGNGYLPQTGTVEAWQPPTGAGIRVDAGIAAGQQVTAHYDPMLAKVIAHGRDRDEARRRLADALDRLVCLGVTTNRTFLARVLRHPVFAEGGATTSFLTDHDVTGVDLDPRDVAAVAGWRQLAATADADRRSPGLAGWTNATWLVDSRPLRVGTDDRAVSLQATGEGIVVTVDDQRAVVTGTPDALRVDGRPVHLTVHRPDGDRLLVHLPHVDLDVSDPTGLPPGADDATGAGVLVAPMHGAVTAVAATVGQQVEAGSQVVVMEAMKMEHVIRADVAGTLVEVVEVGDQVGVGAVVARIDPADTDG